MLAGLGPGAPLKFVIGPGRHKGPSRLLPASPQAFIPNVGRLGDLMGLRVSDVAKPYDFISLLTQKVSDIASPGPARPQKYISKNQAILSPSTQLRCPAQGAVPASPSQTANPICQMLAGLGPGTALKFDIGLGRHKRPPRLVLASPQVLIPNVGWFGALIGSKVLDVTKPYEFLKSFDSKCTRNWL